MLSQTAENYRFEWHNRDTGVKKNVSVEQYMKEKYNFPLKMPFLPLMEFKKGEVYPVEMLQMAYGQRYMPKLSEMQVAKMIKFAATRPGKRLESIKTGLEELKWQSDPYLKTYGMKIQPKMLETQARILDPPEVEFGKRGTAKPMYAGRWDLRGKVFLKPNYYPLKSWGVCQLAKQDALSQ